MVLIQHYWNWWNHSSTGGGAIGHESGMQIPGGSGGGGLGTNDNTGDGTTITIKSRIRWW